MRMIDCDCGRTLQAANDEDMLSVVRGHIDDEHPEMALSDEQIRALVSERAYSATDS